jgi:hypothetical protein
MVFAFLCIAVIIVVAAMVVTLVSIEWSARRDVVTVKSVEQVASGEESDEEAWIDVWAW